MTDSTPPSSERAALAHPAPEPHPVRTRVERGIGAALGVAGGIAVGWLAADVLHLAWQAPVILLAALGAWLGYRFGREVIELTVELTTGR
jgi:hypothetical protein